MFFVVWFFDQNVLIYFKCYIFVFECSIIVVIIFDVDDIVDFNNFLNNCCILSRFCFLWLWHFVVATWIVKIMKFLFLFQHCRSWLSQECSRLQSRCSRDWSLFLWLLQQVFENHMLYFHYRIHTFCSNEIFSRLNMMTCCTLSW